MKAANTIALSFLVGAVAFAAQEGTVLKYVYTKGSETKYQVKGSLDVQGTSVEVTINSVERVLDIADDGTVTVENATIDGKAIFGGNEMEIPAASSITKFSSKGVMKEVKGEGETGGAARLGVLQSFVPSEKAVKFGDKWTHEYKTDAALGTVAAKGEYTYLADERMMDVDCVKIRQVVKETEGDGASMDSVTWLEKSTLKVVKSESKWGNVSMPGAPFPVSGTFTYTMIK